MTAGDESAAAFAPALFFNTSLRSSDISHSSDGGDARLSQLASSFSLSRGEVAFFDRVMANLPPDSSSFAHLKSAYDACFDEETLSDLAARQLHVDDGDPANSRASVDARLWNTLLGLVQVRGRTWTERWDAVCMYLGYESFSGSDDASVIERETEEPRQPIRSPARRTATPPRRESLASLFPERMRLTMSEHPQSRRAASLPASGTPTSSRWSLDPSSDEDDLLEGRLSEQIINDSALSLLAHDTRSFSMELGDDAFGGARQPPLTSSPAQADAVRARRNGSLHGGTISSVHALPRSPAMSPPPSMYAARERSASSPKPHSELIADAKRRTSLFYTALKLWQKARRRRLLLSAHAARAHKRLLMLQSWDTWTRRSHAQGTDEASAAQAANRAVQARAFSNWLRKMRGKALRRRSHQHESLRLAFMHVAARQQSALRKTAWTVRVWLASQLTTDMAAVLCRPANGTASREFARTRCILDLACCALAMPATPAPRRYLGGGQRGAAPAGRVECVEHTVSAPWKGALAARRDEQGASLAALARMAYTDVRTRLARDADTSLDGLDADQQYARHLSDRTFSKWRHRCMLVQRSAATVRQREYTTLRRAWNTWWLAYAEKAAAVHGKLYRTSLLTHSTRDPCGAPPRHAAAQLVLRALDYAGAAL